MRRALLLAPLLWCCAALTALADARLTVLTDVLKLEEAAAILSAEGIQSAAELDETMLGGQGGSAYARQIAAIYDPQRMTEQVRAALGAALTAEAREQVIDFYASDLGTQIIALENSARQAITDPDVEEAARVQYLTLSMQDEARASQISALIASGDMIERNVTSAMNSNFQFLRGMAEGQALEMSEEDMLADVASEMQEIREDTDGWLRAFLAMAYHPLSDDELARYIAFSETEAGRALNRGLFDGFGEAYREISYSLGQAVALNMAAEEL